MPDGVSVDYVSSVLKDDEKPMISMKSCISVLDSQTGIISSVIKELKEYVPLFSLFRIQ